MNKPNPPRETAGLDPVTKNGERGETRESRTRRSLRRAIWINTWAILSLAIAHQKIETCSGITATSSHRIDERVNLPVDSDEAVELEQWDHLGQNWQNKPKEREVEEVIIVATVDGTLAGLSRSTGKTLWKKQNKAQKPQSSDEDRKSYRKGDHMRPHPSSDKAREVDARESESRILSPLVSTTTTTHSTSSSQDWRTAAVPSVDGRVYLTAGRGEGGGAAATDVSASTTVRELVGRAPFVDARGRFYVGSRYSTAAALDSETGEILQVVSPEQNESLQEKTLAGRNVVWLGRVDHSVSLYDARSGEPDVDFSSAEIMSVNDMMVGREPHALDQHSPRLMLPYGVDADGPFAEAPKSSLMVATPGGNIALRDPETGKIQWVADESFETPVAFAVDASSGMSVGVDILPDATIPSGSAEYISQELERQTEVFQDRAGPNVPQTIVNALSTGQLYAMPLGTRSNDQISKLNHPLSLPHAHTAASSAAALTKQGAIASITGRSPAAHAQDISAHSQIGRDKRKRACHPNSPGFPACLVGPVQNIDFSRMAHEGPHSTFLGGENALAVKRDGAVMIQYHPRLGYMAQEDDMQDLLNQKRSRTFFRVMASWLPATMALLFVLSFGVGRRQRLKRHGDAHDSKVSQLEEATGKMVSLDSSGALVRNVGVIQVTEQVLGYGGHGTVVYKGMLDGRLVAVKRMLKTYHASADREISLLIESDGHPNVVRYFLKEMRGDFLYLALELCDLSLHDLIAKLNPSHELSRMQGSIRATLFQVACGVRHLHSLRIVHRDLKPANILLAKSKSSLQAPERQETDGLGENSLYSHFERGEYTAKISDMGLGKQLAGQSSFGLSTLGNASLVGMSNADGSTVGGAGPGSVGWQAPEVMAQRWTLDTSSTRSEASSQGQPDSFVDGSPLDAATSTRTSRSSDIFSLGCIFYCTLVPGSHPFGDWYEREANIMKNKPCIDELDKLSPDAYHLVSSMIRRDPRARPTAAEVINHPFFWGQHQRLSFLCDVSDRLESSVYEDTLQCAPLSGNSLAIERNASDVVGLAWDKKLDDDLLDNVSRFRTYDPSSVRDCLRLIRNKYHHYDELPTSLKDRTGCNPDGLLPYFEAQFPRLVLHCYTTCGEVMAADDPIATNYNIRVGRKDQSEACSIKVIDDADEAADESRHSQSQQSHTPPCADLASNGSSPESDEFVVDDTVLPVDNSSQPFQVFQGDDTVTIVASETFEKEDAVNNHRDVIPSLDASPDDIVIWAGSSAAKTFSCRGWIRSDDEWIRRTGATIRKKESDVKRCAEDPKFRTRLCNHWDTNQGTFCPMQRKNKCIFAHGPVELRVKEGKRNRWGKLVDKKGNNANPCHSGGEDTYGAARSIESARKEEGKWKTDTARKGKPKMRQKHRPP